MRGGLNIAFVDYSEGWSGAVKRVLMLCRGLMDRGHNVVLIAKPGDSLSLAARSAGIKVEEIKILNDGDPGALWRICGVIRRERIDIVDIYHHRAYWLASLAARLMGVRGVLLNRNVTLPMKHRWLDRFLLNVLVDRVVAVSEAIKRGLVENMGLDPRRVEVIYSSREMNEFSSPIQSSIREELAIPEDAPLIGIVSRLDPLKGHAVLIRAMAKVVEEIPEAKLLIVGCGGEEEALRALVRELGLSDSVVFAGFREDVPRVLRALDVFTRPSLEEGLGSAIIEAMAAGRPVVATREGGIPELVEDGRTGLLVPPGDVDGLADALIFILRNRGAARDMASKAREFAERNFSADSMIRRTEAVYMELCSAPRGGIRDFARGTGDGEFD
ncbi:MAG: glycosyltransferase family 4 protein [bacterium]